MYVISALLRLILRKTQSVFFVLRILKLRMLYPGITIDFKSRIEPQCSIVCIKGGKLHISNSKISFGSNIVADKGSTLSIKNTFIGRNCVITSKNKIAIRESLIAEMVVIRDQDHKPGVINTNNDKEQFISAPIEIEENVWIASKATILKGVNIGKSSVIVASSVVTKNIPATEIWGGIPAHFIKKVITTE
jgi:acetyltransferase-like isoleucine patch superfamily enzyme